MNLHLKLTGRIKNRTSIGISEEEVKQLTLTSDLVEDIFQCLNSWKSIDQTFALLFLRSLVYPNTLDYNKEKLLLNRILELMTNSENGVVVSCYELLPRFRQKIPQYRELMLKGLKHDSHVVRERALRYYGTYEQRGDIQLLEAFEMDAFMGEIAMGGPLEYWLRNLALETIEKAIGKTFRKTENIKILPDGRVATWWDWSAYHKWKKSWFRKLFNINKM
jgi:hypothetical protein